MVRTPVICSRRMAFTRSTKPCIRPNSGRLRHRISATISPSSGTLTSSTSDRCASCRTAMTTAPIPMTGAVITIVRNMVSVVCNCCTSLVVRVISEGTPKRRRSVSENACTRSKTALRRRRPMSIEMRAPRAATAAASTICTPAAPSISSPRRTT